MHLYEKKEETKKESCVFGVGNLCKSKKEKSKGKEGRKKAREKKTRHSSHLNSSDADTLLHSNKDILVEK